jgi:RecJ-like exonuclease
MSRQEYRICPTCGGTGHQNITVYTTVWESRTINEYVTEWQFGKPVRVFKPRIERVPVQKPEYRSVVCPRCQGSVKILVTI